MMAASKIADGAKRITALAHEIVSDHELMDHGGKMCCDSRIQLMALVAYTLGLRPHDLIGAIKFSRALNMIHEAAKE